MLTNASSGTCQRTWDIQPLGFRQLAAEKHSALRWLWHGYLADGNVTLLTSQWKSGKTTLLSVLLAKMAAGGELAGLAVRKGRAALVTEETAVHWRLRGNRLGYARHDHLAFFCRPFRGKPDRGQWDGLIDRLVRLRDDGGLDLAVVDTLASFLPSGTENQADALLSALRSLDRLTRGGTAVLLLHHPRKGMPHAGQAARGSGAMCGFADVLIEMHGRPEAGSTDRRRRLTAWSRYDETPRDRMIELSADGCDYRRTDETFDDEGELVLRTIVEILTTKKCRLSRMGFREHWPLQPPPSDTTLWRWLELGLERGVLQRVGVGTRCEPHTYGLAGVKVPWMPCFEDGENFRAEMATNPRARAPKDSQWADTTFSFL